MSRLDGDAVADVCELDLHRRRQLAVPRYVPAPPTPQNAVVREECASDEARTRATCRALRCLARRESDGLYGSHRLGPWVGRALPRPRRRGTHSMRRSSSSSISPHESSTIECTTISSSASPGTSRLKSRTRISGPDSRGPPTPSCSLVQSQVCGAPRCARRARTRARGEERQGRRAEWRRCGRQAASRIAILHSLALLRMASGLCCCSVLSPPRVATWYNMLQHARYDHVEAVQTIACAAVPLRSRGGRLPRALHRCALRGAPFSRSNSSARSKASRR